MITFDLKHDNAQRLLLNWIHQSQGAFSAHDIELHRLDYDDRFLMINFLETLVGVGFLERYGKKMHCYIKAESQLVEMDFKNAVSEPVDLWLPLGLSDVCEIYAGNIIVIAGVPNSGKSALMYNIIKENRTKDWDISLFNSESGAGELRKRLDKFPDMTIDMWDFKAYQRSENFHQVIKSGPNCLNVIDFLEVHSDFFAIGGLIKQIHDKLDGAIAIIGLQKNPGSETGLGGYRMLEVTRLAVALEFQKAKIIKAKSPRDPLFNPNGRYKNFKLHDGYKIVSPGSWYLGEGNDDERD